MFRFRSYLIRIFSFIVIIIYVYYFMYFLLKNEKVKHFYRVFLSILNNREIGEALFIILFLMLPIIIFILITKKIILKIN